MPIIPKFRADTTVRQNAQIRDTANLSAGPDIAGAIGKVGDVVTGHLQKIKQRNDTAGLMEARRKLSDFENSFYDPENPDGISAFKGKNALGANEAFKAQYSQLDADLRSKFNTDQVTQWEGITTQFNDSNLGRLNSHMSRENEQYVKGEREATLTSLNDGYVKALIANQPDVAAARMGEIQGIFLKAGKDDGLSDAEMTEGLTKVTSAAHTLAVESLMLTDPLGAMGYIEKNENTMTAEDSVKVRSKVQPYVDDQVAREVADTLPIMGRDGGAVENPVNNAGSYVPKTELAGHIKDAAGELGIDAMELATFISYETAGSFNPDKKGPVTQWGQHRGLIQWGEPQAKQFGYKPGMPVGDQMKAVVRYLKARGVKPGMSGVQVYAAINGGSVSAVNATDAHNGGRPGTVKDKVADDMHGHRANAKKLFSTKSGDVVVTDPEKLQGQASKNMATEIDVQNYINSRTDLTPKQKDQTMSYWRSNQSMYDRKVADEERRMNEQLAVALDQMKPGQSARDALGPLYGEAVRLGRVSQFDARGKALIEEKEEESDPSFENGLYAMVGDMAGGRNANFKKVDLHKAYIEGKLSSKDYSYWQKQQSDAKGEGKGGDSLKKWTTDAQVFNGMVAQLGLETQVAGPKKNQKETLEAKAERMSRVRALREQWDQVKAGLAARGKLDDPVAIEAAKTAMVRQFLSNPKLYATAHKATTFSNRKGYPKQLVSEARRDFVAARGREPTGPELEALMDRVMK